jgi:hypothetical protein
MMASLFKAFGFITPKENEQRFYCCLNLNYLTFQSFDFERHLVMVILETRRAH